MRAELARRADARKRATEEARRKAEAAARAKVDLEALAAPLAKALDAIRHDLLSWKNVETLAARYDAAVAAYSEPAYRILNDQPSHVSLKPEYLAARHPVTKALPLLRMLGD
jgi:hypothetical protein